MHEMCMCESLCMGLKWKKGSKQQIGKLKNEAQRRPNTKQMRSDLRWNDEHCRWQNYFDIERMNSGMLDMVPNNVFKFYSIHLSFRQNFVYTQRMEEREQTFQRKRQSQTLSDVFTRKQSITKHYFIIWQCSRRLAKQFSTHLWKLKHSLHENSNLKWNWGFQGFRAFMRVFFFAKTDWFRWIYPWAWSCFQTNTKCQRIWSTFHIISQSKRTFFFFVFIHYCVKWSFSRV